MSAALVHLKPEALASRLRDLGIAGAQQIEEAKRELAQSNERFSEILVRQQVLRSSDMGKRMARQLGAFPQRVELGAVEHPGIDRVAEGLWRSHRLAPVQEKEGRILLASDDPLAVFELDFFGARCGCAFDLILVDESTLETLWSGKQQKSSPDASASTAEPSREKPQGVSPGKKTETRPLVNPEVKSKTESKPKVPDAILQPARPATASSETSEDDREVAMQAVKGDDAPVVRLVNSILSEAVRLRASDVHIEPAMNQIRIRYRIDGVLHDVNSPSKALQGPLVSRIKILAGMNIAEKRLPQDQRLQLGLDRGKLDVRVSTLPSMHGESIVMRLLDRSQPMRGLSDMGISEEQVRLWTQLIEMPHGMVLVTGPTGSGKTTTLYGALSELNRPDRKLITIEDPVEYQLSGVNQVAVRSNVGLTFAAGLRSMLRQAPDIIMVGEIRDGETAQVAVQAALTGHLILSTLHTNDAASAITRLVDMDIAEFLVAATVQGVLAQRLVRRICSHCKMTDNATDEERAFLEDERVTQLIHATGCDKCNGSGFLGRVGLYELLRVSDGLRQLIIARTSASEIKAKAIEEGMITLRKDGCRKIREGLTTMGEVLRVVSGGEI